MLKILETVVRTRPSVEEGRLRISADTGIWEEPDDVEVIKKYCLNKFQEEISDDAFTSGGYQLRKKNLIEYDFGDVYLAFLGVTNGQYNYFVVERDEVKPSSEIYEDIFASLELIGFDVCDRLMISAFSHGASPFYGGYGNMSMINKYGLFESIEQARECADLNNKEVSEHKPWYPVGIFVTKSTCQALAEINCEGVSRG